MFRRDKRIIVGGGQGDVRRHARRTHPRAEVHLELRPRAQHTHALRPRLSPRAAAAAGDDFNSSIPTDDRASEANRRACY